MCEPEMACRKLRRFEPALLHRWLQLPPERQEIVEAFDKPELLLWQLRRSGLLPEAIRMLAYALPEREAIWWSCMCVRHTAPSLPDAERWAVDAAEAWVRRPEPATRHEAALAASAPGYAAPGAWSALGAAWSQRERLLPDLCGGRGAVTAVTRAATRGGPERAPERLRRFIESGVDIGNGGAGRIPDQPAP